MTGRFDIGDGVVFQEIQNDVVLLNIHSQQYYGLDGVGAAIWRKMLASGNLDEVRDYILARYPAEPDRVTKDIEALTQDLLEAGLLKVVS